MFSDDFVTDYSETGDSLQPQLQPRSTFDFGTSAERKSKTETEEAMEKLNREGLFHPMLF